MPKLRCGTCAVDFDHPSSTGRHPWECPGCHEATRKEYLKQQRLGRVHRNRLVVRKYLETHPCVDCGETDFVVLQFDHIDRLTKKSTVSVLVLQGRKVEMIEAEIAKCQVRCANCHIRRTAQQFGWRVLDI